VEPVEVGPDTDFEDTGRREDIDLALDNYFEPVAHKGFVAGMGIAVPMLGCNTLQRPSSR
jgi:hypothetical protein